MNRNSIEYQVMYYSIYLSFFPLTVCAGGYYNSKSHRRKFFMNIAKDMGFDYSVPENWYNISRDTIKSYKVRSVRIVHVQNKCVCVLCFVFCILYFVFCVLYFVFCVLYFVFCVLCFVFCIL